MKNIKRFLPICLAMCIGFCAVGCNKVTDTNSSDLSSIITEIETETVIVEEESSTNGTTTEESKIETPATNTPSENTTPTQSTITSSINTPSKESTPSSNETPTTSKDPNAPLTDEELKEFMPDWFFEYPAREIVDICETGMDTKRYFVITTQNELYELSPYKLFSNGTHFKKVESNLKFVRFTLCSDSSYSAAVVSGNGVVMITTDNRYYSYGGDGLLTSATCRHGNNYPCPRKNNVFAPLSNANKIDMREVFDGNFVAQIKYESNNILSLDNEILYSFPQDETIISAVTHIVQTTKGYYYIHAKTEQEFADSEPVTTYSAEFIGTKPEDRFIKYFRKNRGRFSN